jgi:hypothetical protein
MIGVFPKSKTCRILAIALTESGASSLSHPVNFQSINGLVGAGLLTCSHENNIMQPVSLVMLRCHVVFFGSCEQHATSFCVSFQMWDSWGPNINAQVLQACVQIVERPKLSWTAPVASSKVSIASIGRVHYTSNQYHLHISLGA